MKNKKLTPIIMFYRSARGEKQHVIKEWELNFKLTLWDRLKILVNHSIDDFKTRQTINKIIKQTKQQTLLFLNNIKDKEYRSGVRVSKLNYKLDIDQFSKNTKSNENTLEKYGFKGLTRKVASLIMSGYTQIEIIKMLNITEHVFLKQKEKMKFIILHTNKTTEM